MQNETGHRPIDSVEELGRVIRDRRKQAGYATLDSGARACAVGKRFLSEIERGKETAEIGKVFAVLHALGLELAVIEQSNSRARPVLQRLELDFPYDWSNSGMNDDLLIHKALEKGRFMDLLRLTGQYGIDRLERVAHAFSEAPNGPRLRQILGRIRTGQAKATP